MFHADAQGLSGFPGLGRMRSRGRLLRREPRMAEEARRVGESLREKVRSVQSRAWTGWQPCAFGQGPASLPSQLTVAESRGHLHNNTPKAGCL